MWNSEIFSSSEDRIILCLDGKCSDGYWVFYGYTADGIKKELYRGKISGDFEIRHEADPISLGVYQDVLTFSVAIEGECTVREWKIDLPQTSVSVGESVSVVKDGTVPVMQLDGSIIRVPVAPKNVLFIGNSLILGMYELYGMCSTAPDKDYTYLTSQEILKYSPDCSFTKLRGNFIEQAQSVEEYEELLYRKEDVRFGFPPIECFTEDLDLITLQLMDNVNTPEKVSAFAQNLPVFLRTIKERCPKARIIWIYGWYMKPDVLPTLLAECKKWDIETLDISPAHTKENESYSGQLSFHPSGEMVVVPDLWISHPGDPGMRAIADLLTKKLFS